MQKKWFILLLFVALVGLIEASGIGSIETSEIDSIEVSEIDSIEAYSDNDWPGWRGPDRNSISKELDWNPDTLLKEPKILWEADLGNGYSTVSINGPFLYTMGNQKNKDTVFCLKVKTGEIVWKYSYPCGVGQYAGPKATPLYNDGKLYTLSEKGHLFCLNAQNGKVLWKKNLITDLKALSPTWGFASSPVITGNTLLINACKYGVAMDKKTGKLLWKSPEVKCGYSAPVLYKLKNIQYVAMFGQKAVYGVHLEKGELVWSYPWITSHDVNATDPLIIEDKVLISSDYGKGSALLKIKENKPSLLWENTNLKSHFSSIIYKDGYIYGNDGSPGYGTFKCIELKSGKEKWNSKLGFGSLMATQDHLIILTERGNLHIAKLTPKAYMEVSKVKVLTGTCWSPPVLCNGKIFCRNSRGKLVCIDVRKKQKKNEDKKAIRNEL